MILMENIVFIILNLIFLMILILFLARQGEGAVLLEQTYAKQIALLIDSAKPGMVMVIDMEKGKKVAEKNSVDFGEIVKVNGNVVTVRLSEKGGYSYSFFNDVGVSVYLGPTPEKEGHYVISVNSYN